MPCFTAYSTRPYWVPGSPSSFFSTTPPPRPHCFLNTLCSFGAQGLRLCSSFWPKGSSSKSSHASLFLIIQISAQKPPPKRPSLKPHPCHRHPLSQRFLKFYFTHRTCYAPENCCVLLILSLSSCPEHTHTLIRVQITRRERALSALLTQGSVRRTQKVFAK